MTKVKLYACRDINPLREGQTDRAVRVLARALPRIPFTWLQLMKP